MTREQRAKMRADEKAQKLAGTPCAECAGVLPAHGEACSLYVKPPVDLDDAAQQEAILNPEPKALTIGGVATALHPLPSKKARKFVPVVGRVVAAGAKATFGTYRLRFGMGIADDDALSAEVSAFIARAEHPADPPIADEALAERAAQIDDTATFEEFADAFDRLCEQNNIEEIFARPKSEAPSETTTP